MADKKYQKIRPMTKQDKQYITKVLDRSLNSNTDNYSDTHHWIDDLKTIDVEVFSRSLAQILNGPFDSLPQQIIDQNPLLIQLSKNVKTPITIMHVLSLTDTLFRFAPSPSGYLHIGHFVPILLNILLRTYSRLSGRNSDIVLRIDDTNPEEEDFSENICKTLRQLMGPGYDELIVTRSSVFRDKVVDLIAQSIMRGDDKFYVDLTDQETMKKQRADRTENQYRKMNINDQQALWDEMKQGKHPDAVIRAKIDMKQDNGNLRDPVMLRFVRNTDGSDTPILMPTYDLVCPVLDSFDASINNKNLIALRDCNYYDRLDQYVWIQLALGLKQTAVVTFSRVNFENILLSKRKIKKLIVTGKIDSWEDPRLMTIDGIFNRGMTLMGLLNFYWLSSSISVGNRSTSQHVDTLFSANDKVLSQRSNFIIDRMPIGFDIDTLSDADKDAYLIISIMTCVSKSSCRYLKLDSKHDEQDPELCKVPDLVKVQDLYSKLERLVSCNLKHINDLITSQGSIDLDKGADLIKDLNLSSDKFKIIKDVKVGDTVKINNFKNLDTEPIFGGYYYVMSKDSYFLGGHVFDRLSVIHIV